MLSFVRTLDDKFEIKQEIDSQMINLLENISTYSNRFKRQLTHMSVPNTFDENEANLRVNELDECLSSVDIRHTATFKFMIAHLIKLLELSNRQGLSKSQLNCILRLVVERIDQLDDEGREIVAKLFSLIGPVYDHEIYEESVDKYLSVEDKCRKMVMEKFENETSEESIFYRFYMRIIEKLLDALNDEEYESLLYEFNGPVEL